MTLRLASRSTLFAQLFYLSIKEIPMNKSILVAAMVAAVALTACGKKEEPKAAAPAAAPAAPAGSQAGMSGMQGMEAQKGMEGMSGMQGMSGMSGMQGMEAQKGMQGEAVVAKEQQGGMAGMSGMEAKKEFFALPTKRGCGPLFRSFTAFRIRPAAARQSPRTGWRRRPSLRCNRARRPMPCGPDPDDCCIR